MKIDTNQISTQVQSEIQKAIANVQISKTWLQKHQTYIIVLIIVLGVVFLINKALERYSSYEDKKANAEISQLNIQKQKDTELASQVKIQTEQYQELVRTLEQENAKLVSSINTRTVVLQQQVVKDQTLPLPDLGKRLGLLAQLSGDEVTATSSGLNLTESGARKTVSTLEQVPVLQENLIDEISRADNNEKLVNTGQVVQDGLNNQITSLQMTVTQQDKTCKAQISAATADARKGKFKSFFYGVGAGFGAAIAVAVTIAVH